MDMDQRNMSYIQIKARGRLPFKTESEKAYRGKVIIKVYKVTSLVSASFPQHLKLVRMFVHTKLN